MTMPAQAIRPRSAIEIVDAAFALFRANFATMAVIGLAASVPFVVMIALFFNWMIGGSWRQFVTAPPLDMIPALLLAIALLLLWFAIVDGAMTYAAAEAYHGNKPSPGDAIRGAFSEGITLIAGNFLRMAIIGGVAIAMSLVWAVIVTLLASTGSTRWLFGLAAILFFLFVFAGIATTIARTFAITSAIVIERRSALAGIARSFSLSRKATLRIVGVGFLCLCIYWVAQIAGMVVVNVVVGAILRSPIVAAVLGNVVAMLVYPFLNIALMVLYFDQRVRKEGYDLDVLAGLTPVAPAPAQP